MNDSRDYQDAESVRCGQSHVASQPVFFPPFPVPGGMQSRSKGMPSRKDEPPSIWHTHGKSGNVTADPVASSTAPNPQELNPWSFQAYQNRFTHQRRRRMRIKHQCKIRDASPDRQPKIQSSPRREYFLRTMEQTNEDLQISDLHFDKFLTPATFACWKIRFKTEVCTCSQFPTEAMQWIKEVELVDSVDDLKSSCSVRGIRMPDFEVLMRELLQHWTESPRIPVSRRSVWRKWKLTKKTVSFVEDRSLT